AVELGEHDVEEDQVGSLRAPQAESLGPVRGQDDVVALLLQRVLKQSLDIRVVVDDKDLCRHQSPSWLPRSGALWATGGSIIGTPPRASGNARRRNTSTLASYAAGAVAWPALWPALETSQCSTFAPAAVARRRPAF